jgi:PhnB protein
MSNPVKRKPAKKVRPVPLGYHTVAPHLCVDGAARALDFYRKALGAQELICMKIPGGKIGHAEMQIGDSRIMLSDEFPDFGNLSPKTLGGTPVTIHLYVKDVDALASQAVAAGAKVMIPVADQFYGDRSGRIQDPFGHVWIISTHIEDVTPEEVERRTEAYMKQFEAKKQKKSSSTKSG